MDLLAEMQEFEAAKKPQIRKLRYSHEAMVELIITNPWISQNEIAAIFGRTPPWISIVMNSDAFKARLEERREELVDPTLRVSIKERFTAALTRSLERLQEKLEQPSVPDNLILRSIEVGAKGLGVGGFAPTALPAAPPPPTGDRLVILADRLLALQRDVQNRGATDATIIQETANGQEVLPPRSHAAP